MATFTSAQAAADFPFYTPAGGRAAGMAFGSLAITAAPVAADIYQMCKLPAGATVVGGWFGATDIDTGTGVMELDVGWAATTDEVADPDGFLDSGALNGTAVANYLTVGTLRPFLGVLQAAGPKTFTAPAIVTLTCVVAPNAFTAGRVTVWVNYVTP
jgi:hypothetical protein